MWNVANKSVLARQQGLKAGTLLAVRLDSNVTWPWTHEEYSSLMSEPGSVGMCTSVNLLAAPWSTALHAQLASKAG